VMPGGRQVGDALPLVGRRVEPERSRDRLAGAIESAGDVDLAPQHGGAHLLDRLGERRGGGPAAVGGEDRCRGDAAERDAHRCRRSAHEPPLRVAEPSNRITSTGSRRRAMSSNTMRYCSPVLRCTACTFTNARPPSLVSTQVLLDRKSTRLNSSHVAISYAVFCLKKKKETSRNRRRIRFVSPR